MDSEQRHQLWKFARGDAKIPDFEQWLYSAKGLEKSLGDDLYLSLISCDFSGRDETWAIRKTLAELLQIQENCECPGIKDLAAIPMGGDFYSETIFKSLETVAEFGRDKWWLYISKCKICRELWMVAQDDRIYDDFFLNRIDEVALGNARLGIWPDVFLTYESVLAFGRKLSSPPRFLEPLAYSLQWTVEDLQKERPEISGGEIANLLGLTPGHAAKLVRYVKTYGTDKLE